MLITNATSKEFNAVASLFIGYETKEEHEQWTGESISQPWWNHAQNTYYQFLPYLQRFAAFFYHTGASVEEAYEFYRGEVNLPQYWFDQRKTLLGLLHAAYQFVEVNIDHLGEEEFHSMITGTGGYVDEVICRLNPLDAFRWRRWHN